jgi:V8-like Glu-specific endopeptidase
MLTSLTHATEKVVYGEDNRKDLYQVTNPLYLKLANSTAGMVNSSIIRYNWDDTISINSQKTLEEGLKVCSSEKFSNQKLLTNCSGFLIGEDTLVTAGHCMSDHVIPQACKNFTWVFGLHMESSSYINLRDIPMENVYACKKIKKVIFSQEQDFAVIQLDRKVTGRTPLKYRKSGKVSNNTELLVIGHPSMLPTKVARGGKVVSNEDKFQIRASLDTFQGNSGSAVFDAKTGLLEGILVNGKTDYVPSLSWDKTSCKIVNKCNQKGDICYHTRNKYDAKAEGVTRITTLLEYL